MTNLTCLMPTYNKEQTLAKAIESVIMQKTDFDYKLIILDDCSTDNSNQIAQQYKEKYPNKIDIVRNETNLKLLRSIINGYKLLKDVDYFCVLDADDWYTYDKKFAEAVEFLDENQDYSMYMTNITLKKEDTEAPWYGGNLEILDFDFEDRKNNQAIFIQTSGVVYRNIYFKNGYNSDFEKILEYKFPESYRADGFRFEWYLQGGKAHFENKITAVYNYDLNGIWSSMTEDEQSLHNAKMMYSCAEFIQGEKLYYLNCAKHLYDCALNGLKNDYKIFTKNKDLICELTFLLLNSQIKPYKKVKKLKYKILLWIYKKLHKKLSRKGIV